MCLIRLGVATIFGLQCKVGDSKQVVKLLRIHLDIGKEIDQ